MTDEIVDEMNRELRGHVFYPPADAVAGIPGLYGTEKVPLDEKVIHLHYFVGRCDWWLVEYDPKERRGFGYACLGDPICAEWGYVDLTELERIQVGPFVVERDLYWTPCKAGEANLPD